MIINIISSSSNRSSNTDILIVIIIIISIISSVNITIINIIVVVVVFLFLFLSLLLLAACNYRTHDHSGECSPLSPLQYTHPNAIRLRGRKDVVFKCQVVTISGVQRVACKDVCKIKYQPFAEHRHRL